MKKYFILLFVFVMINGAVSAQSAYVDFHTHLTFKHYYNDITDPQQILKLTPNPQQIKTQYGLSNWQPFGQGSTASINGDESNFKNYYQTNFSELGPVQGSILCNAFYPWEKIRTLSWVNRLIDHWWVSKLSMSRLKLISDDNDNPFLEFMAEYHYAANQAETYNGISVKFTKDGDELRENLKNNVTSSILTIEGAQVLSGPYNANSDRIETNVVDQQSEKEIMDNVHTLKNLDHRLFFITTSHFSWNRVSGYAKTLDKFGFRRKMISWLSSFESFRSSTFLKSGEGIHGMVGLYDKDNAVTCSTQDGDVINVITREGGHKLTIGYQVIEEFLNPNSSKFHKPTYIDVKHMDILARMEYYHLKDSLEKVYHIKIPVIASHTAVSGENQDIAAATGLYPLFDKYQEIKDPLKYYEKEAKYTCDWEFRYKGKDPFAHINKDAAGWFYPWSINLYDEEISIIHDSDGIMGLMLDGRQLGENMINYTPQYKQETKKAFADVTTQQKYSYNNFDEYYEVVPFIRNLLYIAEHCGNKICWDHVSLGSDFDGLIHPMKVCRTVKDIPDFKKKLTAYFQIYLKINHKESDLAGLSAEHIMDKLFYANGKDFILKYF